MNHSNSKLLVSFAAVWAVLSNSAGGQMRQPYSNSTVLRGEMYVRPFFMTEEQWVNLVVDRWLPSQRRAWQSLDPRFRSWVSHLLWTRKNVGRLSSVSDPQEPIQIPSSCSVDAFVAPVDSVGESMDHYRELMPDINWNAWNNIEPNFRDVAEWEVSAEHARAQLSKARKQWWDLNRDGIRSCLDAEEPSSGLPPTIGLIATAGSQTQQQSSHYEQIDARARAELRAVDHMIAPEPVKREAQQRIRDASAVDKYISGATRRNL